jgi:hypothetical protein
VPCRYESTSTHHLADAATHECSRMEKLVDELSVPPPDSQPLHFPNRYSQPMFQQFLICHWRNRQAYWYVLPTHPDLHSNAER